MNHKTEGICEVCNKVMPKEKIKYYPDFGIFVCTSCNKMNVGEIKEIIKKNKEDGF